MNQGTQVRINSMKTINVLVLGIGGNTSLGIINASKKSYLLNLKESNVQSYKKFNDIYDSY